LIPLLLLAGMILSLTLKHGVMSVFLQSDTG